MRFPYQPWPVALPLLVFTAAPAAVAPWGLPDLRERDKQEHAAGGAVIGAAGTAAAVWLAPRSTWFTRWLLGVAAAAAAGAAKEALDARTHEADPRDAIATVAGGAAGALTVTLVWKF